MSVELAYRVRPQGADDLKKITDSLRASDEATKKAAAGLKEYDAAAGKAVSGMGRARAAVEANTNATLRLIDLLDKLHAAQTSTGESAGNMAIGVGLASAGFNKAFESAERLAAAVVDLVTGTADLAEQQANTAVRTGLTVKEVGLFEAAAKEAGISANAYTTAMRTLSGALSQNSEEGKKAKRALAELGVEARDSDGVLRPMRDIWTELASAIGAVDDPAKRARLAIDLLGRAGVELLPQLTSEMGTVLTELERMGVGFDDAGAKAANNFGNALDRMKTAWDKWYQDVGVRFAEFVGYGDSPQSQGRTIVTGGGFGVFAPNPSAGPDRAGPARAAVQRELDRAKEAARGRQRQADESAINATLARQETLQEKLGEARKNRDEAARNVDRAAFERANAEVRSLEARIEGEKRYKEAQAERQRQEKAFAAEIERLVKGANDRDARRTGSYIERAGEGARRLSDSAELRDEMRALEVRTIQANERILGPAALRLSGRNAAGTAFAGMDFGGQLKDGVRLWDMEREHRLRMIELTAGPGGELAAARAVYDLRIASASTEVERQEARIQLEERLAQLAQDRLRKYEETAGRVYDSIKQGGGGGLRDFGRGQFDILQRQIFVNASSGLFQQFGGVLGKVGAASGLGGLLRGTIFDPANAQPIDKNTLALNRVGGALDRLYGALSGVPVAGGDGSYSLPGGVLQGGTGLVMSLFGGRGGSNSTNLGGIFGFAGGGGGSQQLTRNQRIAGGAGAAALGAYGIYSGIRQGGTGGFLTAAGGALGAASAIPGPQQPFLQGAALVVGFLGSLFGGDKGYEEKQQRMLDAARYAGPTGRDVLSDGRGGYVDYDYRGNVRVIERPVYVQVQALDSRSFIDARQDIASAVRQAIIDGTDLSDTVRDLTMPR